MVDVNKIITSKTPCFDRIICIVFYELVHDLYTVGDASVTVLIGNSRATVTFQLDVSPLCYVCYEEELVGLINLQSELEKN
ncbi:hypothetical protein T12_4403 [Trichinella patagoniensis]|uniref:Uncharacterized protein n=1 Tax=Trichinella patagoniensis TaxID=990121 RepID=A0A0V0ZU42_9BILA|nr:hypothetical protein T12_4403 [Trichinella patagoniensis]